MRYEKKKHIHYFELSELFHRDEYDNVEIRAILWEINNFEEC